MGTKKIAISFAGIGSALLALSTKLQGADKTEVEAISAALTELGNQPIPVDKALVKERDGLVADVAKLSKDIAGKDTLIATLQAGQKEAAGIVNELKAQLQVYIDKEVKAPGKLTVKVDGVTYQVNHGSHPHSAKDLAESPELAAEILKIQGQNTLTKL